jgi:hypothetical protein
MTKNSAQPQVASTSNHYGGGRRSWWHGFTVGSKFPAATPVMAAIKSRQRAQESCSSLNFDLGVTNIAVLSDLPRSCAILFDERGRHPEQFAKQIAHLYAHPDEMSHDEIELFVAKSSSPRSVWSGVGILVSQAV